MISVLAGQKALAGLVRLPLADAGWTRIHWVLAVLENQKEGGGAPLTALTFCPSSLLGHGTFPNRHVCGGGRPPSCGF